MSDIKAYIDLLVNEFWKQGYTILSRRYGKYLPEPPLIGEYPIDILAKRDKDFAIGITISEAEVNDTAILNRLVFLSSRVTRGSKRSVHLIVGAPISCYRRIKELMDSVGLISKGNASLCLLTDAEADLFSAVYNRNAERAKSLPFN